MVCPPPPAPPLRRVYFAATREEPAQVSIDRLAAIGFSLLGSFSPGAAAAAGRRSMVQIEDLMGLILAGS